MNAMDRRKILADALCGVSAGNALMPGAAALPLNAPAAARLADVLKDDVKPAQVVIAPTRPRLRRWVCSRNHGRRACGWRRV
jgi:hypothetical protein